MQIHWDLTPPSGILISMFPHMVICCCCSDTLYKYHSWLAFQVSFVYLITSKFFKRYNSDNLNVFFFKGIVGGVGPPGFPGLRVSTLYLLRYGLVRIFVLYVCEIIFKNIRIQGFKQILFYLAMISIKITLQNCCHIPGMEYFCILHFWSGVSGVFLWNNKLCWFVPLKPALLFEKVQYFQMF